MTTSTDPTLTPAVRAAITALDTFGAVNVRTATALLGYWRRRDELSDADVAAVLAHYDDDNRLRFAEPRAWPALFRDLPAAGEAAGAGVELPLQLDVQPRPRTDPALEGNTP